MGLESPFSSEGEIIVHGAIIPSLKRITKRRIVLSVANFNYDLIGMLSCRGNNPGYSMEAVVMAGYTRAQVERFKADFIVSRIQAKTR